MNKTLRNFSAAGLGLGLALLVGCVSPKEDPKNARHIGGILPLIASWCNPNYLEVSNHSLNMVQLDPARTRSNDLEEATKRQAYNAIGNSQEQQAQYNK